ncbi:hypothetical protein D3C85_812030 [compost metagenome]
MRGRGEKQGAVRQVHAHARASVIDVGTHVARMLPGKIQGGNHDAAQHGQRQVREHGDHRHGHDHQRILQRHLAQHAQRAPGKRLLRHDEHHADQSGQRDALDQGRQEQDEQQDHHAGRHARQARAAARAQVDHRLPDHGAAAHAAKQARNDVRCTECDAFAVRLAPRFSHLIGKIKSEQGFQQSHHGHQGRIREDDVQGRHVQRHRGPMQGRQAAGDMRKVAQGARRQLQEMAEHAHAQDGHQRGRHRLRDARQHVDDGHGEQHQRAHYVQGRALQPGFTLRRGLAEVFQLSHGDDDGQAIHEAQHHRVWHHTDQFTKAQDAEQRHDDAAQHHGRQQILHAMLGHQGHDNDGHGTGGAGNHAGAPAKDGRECANDEGAVQAHQGIQLRHEGKGDAFGHQRE